MGIWEEGEEEEGEEEEAEGEEGEEEVCCEQPPPQEVSAAREGLIGNHVVSRRGNVGLAKRDRSIWPPLTRARYT